MEHGVIPEKFGDFVTLRDEQGAPVLLGTGGFGTTVRAYRSRVIDGKEIRQEAAVKILRAKAIKDPKRRRSFVDEIIALSELQHPNLVRYMDCGEQDGSIFMVMDLCRGGDLARLVRKLGRLSERAALLAVLQICAGLEEAHRKGYLHRDLKPHNVLLADPFPPDGTMEALEHSLAGNALRLKIGDFGFAGRIGTESAWSGFFGSPMFASPEQVMQRRDLDFRSDIYSLGMTLWFMVVGKGPLVRADGHPVDDAREAMEAHTSPEPHDSRFPATLSPEFRELMSRMVRKSRDERFASLSDLMRAVSGLLERLPLPAAGTDILAEEVTADELPPIALAQQPAWGHGEVETHYAELEELGRRPLGRLHRATLKEPLETQYGSYPVTTEVGLTVWRARRPLEDPAEVELANYLAKLWSLTWSKVAPPTLARIADVRRTEREWCVCEEWFGGMTLESIIAARSEPFSFPEVVALLMPIAEAIDFLRQRQLAAALLDTVDIRIFTREAESPAEDWTQKPLASWPKWGTQVSALAIPAALSGGSPGADSASSAAFYSVDYSQLPLTKSFARLVYHLLERTEAPVAADWDSEAYDPCPQLGDPSNLLLRNTICGAAEPHPAAELLRILCENEAVSEWPGNFDPTIARPVPIAASPSAEEVKAPLESSVFPAIEDSSLIETVCLHAEPPSAPEAAAADDEPELDIDAPTVLEVRLPVPPPAPASPLPPAAKEPEFDYDALTLLNVVLPPPPAPAPAPAAASASIPADEEPELDPDASTVFDVKVPTPPPLSSAPVEEEPVLDPDAPTVFEMRPPTMPSRIILPSSKQESDEPAIRVIDDAAPAVPPPLPPPPPPPPPLKSAR